MERAHSKCMFARMENKHPHKELKRQCQRADDAARETKWLRIEMRDTGYKGDDYYHSSGESSGHKGGDDGGGHKGSSAGYYDGSGGKGSDDGYYDGGKGSDIGHYD
eukprot:6771167-Pyramimonas_sp.AAC.1